MKTSIVYASALFLAAFGLSGLPNSQAQEAAEETPGCCQMMAKAPQSKAGSDAATSMKGMPGMKGMKMDMPAMMRMMNDCPMCKAHMKGGSAMNHQDMMKMMNDCPSCKKMMGSGMMNMPGMKGMPGMAGAMGTQGLARRSGNLSVRLQTSPAPPQAGRTRFTATVRTAAGAPVNGASVTLGLSMPSMGMGGPTLTLRSQGKGVYSGVADLGMAGDWQADVTVSRRGMAPAKLGFPFGVR